MIARWRSSYRLALGILICLLLGACSSMLSGAGNDGPTVVQVTGWSLPTQTKTPFYTRTPIGTLVPPYVDMGTPIAEVVAQQPLQLDPDCLEARFVSDVTIPDGAHLPAGEAFTKTWRLKNTSTCAWTNGFALVLVNSNIVDAPKKVTIGQDVGTGEVIDVSITMIAPLAPGEYRLDYQLEAPGGLKFGLGTTGQGTAFLEFVVGGEASFTLEIAGFHLCSQNYTTVRIINTGEVPLVSVAIRVFDLEYNELLFERDWQDQAFLPSKKSCPPGTKVAEQGGEFFLAANIGPVRSKHYSIFEVTACAEEATQGTCAYGEVYFLTP